MLTGAVIKLVTAKTIMFRCGGCEYEPYQEQLLCSTCPCVIGWNSLVISGFYSFCDVIGF